MTDKTARWMLGVTLILQGCNMHEPAQSATQKQQVQEQLTDDQLRFRQMLMKEKQPVVITDEDYKTMSYGNPYRAEIKEK